ncbi:hypothetical protein [Parvularcula oceani]|uniref:hypothetical protein n=1 Tax=Parvularcula oceani TaxID=1247963 RepID=UPI00068E50A4|nr:hypothetical protein [Parvularcula oceani]
MKLALGIAANIAAVAAGTAGGTLLRPDAADAAPAAEAQEAAPVAHADDGPKPPEAEAAVMAATEGASGAASEAAATAPTDAPRKHGAEEAKSDPGAEDSHAGAEAKDTYTIRFSRPFIVPAADGWRTQALVVLNLGVTIDQKSGEAMDGLEIKIRDRIMTALVAYAHEGGFDGPVADPYTLERVRDRASRAVATLFEDGHQEVLIADMIKKTV